MANDERIEEMDDLVENVEVEDEEVEVVEKSIDESKMKKKSSMKEMDMEDDDEEEDDEEEEDEVNEAIRSRNEYGGYRNEVGSDEKYAKTHTMMKKLLGADDLTIRDYLDSKAGRHLAGLEGDKAYIKKDFKRFMKNYNPDLFKEAFDADLQALVESEATLSEGFKDKASIIFEAALKSKLSEKTQELEESYKAQLNEEVSSFKENLTESVNDYLTYAVNNWMEENALQVENGLRTEIAENFIDQLKTVFVENYAEVPESKVDVVDQLAEEVVELEDKLDAKIESEIKLIEELNQFKKAAIINEHSSDLAQTEIEKLKSLTEDIEFVNAEAFNHKVEVIKETYFKKSQVSSEQVEEINEDATTPVVTSSTIDSYLKAIKSNRNFS